MKGGGKSAFCAIPDCDHLDYVYGEEEFVRENIYRLVLKWLDDSYKESDCRIEKPVETLPVNPPQL